MRKIIAAAFISLDGVMQAPGGPEEDPTGGFEHGGWVAGHWDDAVGTAVSESFAAPFDLLLGRKTYDIFAAHWPYVETATEGDAFEELNSDIAVTFNRVTKYVATHRPESLTWQNSKALGPDVVARLRELKQEDGPNLLIQGSGEFIQTLLAHDLIDEFRLSIFPLVLRKGKRLFGDGTQPRGLTLTKWAASPNGVLIATYERGGKVATGSFAMEAPTEAEIERRKSLV